MNSVTILWTILIFNSKSLILIWFWFNIVIFCFICTLYFFVCIYFFSCPYYMFSLISWECLCTLLCAGYLWLTELIQTSKTVCCTCYVSFVSSSIFPLLLSDSETKLKTLKCSKVADSLCFLHRVLVRFKFNINTCFSPTFSYSSASSSWFNQWKYKILQLLCRFNPKKWNGCLLSQFPQHWISNFIKL